MCNNYFMTSLLLRTCTVWVERSEVMVSCVCRSSLVSPSAQRSLLSSAGDANNRLHEFLETFVADGGGQLVSYANM